MTARKPAARLTAELLEDRTVPSLLGIGGLPPVGPLSPLLIGGLTPVVPQPLPNISAPFVRGLAVGYEDGLAARVRVYQTPTQFQDFKAFDDPFDRPIRVATGDVNGDGVPDVIVTLGFSGSPTFSGFATVTVFDGATLGQPTPRVIRSLNPLGNVATGFDVAAADFDRDGKADVVVSTASQGSFVEVFSGADIVTSSSPFPIALFHGIDDPNFFGGATVATSDVNGDGTPDLVVGAGPGGGPRVAVFDGTSLRAGQAPRKLFNDFFAFDPAVRAGVNVAVMDVNHDGRGDILVGLASGAPEMVAIDGAALLASGGVTVSKFFDEKLGNTSSVGGIEMVVRDFDGDGIPDLAVCHNDTTQVTVYRGRFFYSSGGYVFPGQFDAAPSGTVGGVWVG